MLAYTCKAREGTSVEGYQRHQESTTPVPQGESGRQHFSRSLAHPQHVAGWSRSWRASISRWHFQPERRKLFSEAFAPFEVLYLFIEGKGGHCAVQVEHVLAEERPHAQRQALHVFCHRSHCCDHWKRPEENIHGWGSLKGMSCKSRTSWHHFDLV